MLATTNDSAQPQRKIPTTRRIRLRWHVHRRPNPARSSRCTCGVTGSCPTWRASLAWWGLRYKLHLPQSQDEARELVFSARDLSHRDIDKSCTSSTRAPSGTAIVRRSPPRSPSGMARAASRCLSRQRLHPSPRMPQGARGLTTLPQVWSATTEGNYTGRVEGTVVQGPGRSRRSRVGRTPTWARAQGRFAYAYGDHHTDAALLSAAAKGYAVRPERRLGSWRHGWEHEWGRLSAKMSRRG